MNLIDEQYTRMPFYGVVKMTPWLIRQGFPVNPKRVRRLLRRRGLEAIYPKRRLSIPSEEYRKYPYLLRGLAIARPDQVWCVDITYLRMRHGFLYLVALRDWYSRSVLAWELSNTLDQQFCLDALVFSPINTMHYGGGRTYRRICSGVLIHAKGLASMFHECRNRSIAVRSWATEPKLPRRIARRERMLNQASIWLSQDAPVGVG